jgi:hypothetical protein
MKRNHSLLTSAVALALFLLGSQAHATAWVDFSSTEQVIDVAFDDPTTEDTEFSVLRRVTLTCPKDGFLVATGTAGFATEVSESIPRNILYDITIDKAEINFTTAYEMRIDLRIDSPDIFVTQPQPGSGGIVTRDEERSVGQIFFSNEWNLPGSIQRIFRCKKGKKHTFYFVASSRSAGHPELAKADGPKLVVEFFDTRL